MELEALSRHEIRQQMVQGESLERESLVILLKRFGESSLQDKDTIDDLNKQVSMLSLQLASLTSIYAAQAMLEREKFQVEKECWEKEARVLASRLQFAQTHGPVTRPAFKSDTPIIERNDGPMMGNDYAPGVLEALRNTPESFTERENKLLWSDRHFLESRVRNLQAQCDRSEIEIKRMRAHLLSSAPVIVEVEDASKKPTYTLPSVLGKTFSADPNRPVHVNKHRPTRKGPLMADAEAEHLLLAGKTLESVRRVLKTVHPPNKDGTNSKKRKVKEKEERDHDIDDLLQAADSLLPGYNRGKKQKPNDPPSILQPLPATAPFLLHVPGTSKSKPDAGADILSGLDVLADQAAASQESSGSSSVPNRQASVPSHTPLPFDPSLSLLPLPGSSTAQQLVTRPSYASRSQLPQTDAWMSLPSLTASTSGSANNNLDPARSVLPPDAHYPLFPDAPPLSSKEEYAQSRKARIPYLKWSLEEDEQLVEAILQHGLRWDLVTKSIPSRAYHQVRQRWMRGLKAGEALPPELAHYLPQLQEAMASQKTSRRSATFNDYKEAEGSSDEEQLQDGNYDPNRELP